MVKLYKTLNSCRLCKKRYVVKEDSKFAFRSKYYCEDCCEKHFKHEKSK